VKLIKSLQFWHISHDYSNLQHSTTRISMWRISPSAQNFYDIKNKYWSIQAELNQFLYFQLSHYNLAYCFAHRLSIARYCFRSAPPHITYSFFICVRGTPLTHSPTFYSLSIFFLSPLPLSLLIVLVLTVTIMVTVTWCSRQSAAEPSGSAGRDYIEHWANLSPYSISASRTHARTS
jgi:hypothetical protein